MIADSRSFPETIFPSGRDIRLDILLPNLFSFYQITHIGSHKKVSFSPNDVEISDIVNGRFIAKGFADRSSKVYRFSHFMPYSNPSSLLTHANGTRNLWHERFGHLI